MQHFLSVEEYQREFREKMILENKKFCLRTQILLAAIGPSIENSKFYVFYENFTYSFESILEAFEFAFQLHIVFNLSYQAQAQHFWYFIQYYFYDIPISTPGMKQKQIMKHADIIKSN